MIGSYLKDDVTIVRATALDRWNKKIVNEEKKKAFVQFKRRWTRSATGDEMLSNAVVLMDPDVELSLEDRIKFEDLTWNIISISKQRDFSTRYLEVIVI